MKSSHQNSSLSPTHWDEIVNGSGVSEAIATLNFWTITDPSEADELLNRNAKKRWQHSGNLVPAWAVAGIDPKTGERWLQGVQLKPDTPVELDGKPQKYLSASGHETAPLFLDNGELDYWQKVLGDRTTPVIVTEGSKKAACLLTLQHAAISLPGVWNAQLKGRLKTSIKQFCGIGRRVYLCFDSDQTTNPKVQQALDRLGRLLSVEGCVVSVVVWDAQYKGVDDLYVQAGAEAVHDAIANALTLEEWKHSLKKLEKSEPSQQPHFESSIEGGLRWVSFERDDDTGEFKRSSIRVGNHLEALAYVENTEQGGAALLLEFQTVRGQVRRWQMPRSGLAGNAAALLDELLGRGYGLVYEQTKRLKRYLVELGQGVEKTYTITDKTGWVGDSFVLENRTYGDDSIRFRDVEPVSDSAYELRGTLDGWRSEVAALCRGNSRLILGLGIPLAAALAPVLGIEGGGFHLYGATSTGKTTTLKIAGSVVGIPSRAIKLWRATANGLEGLATAHNHLPLLLDEIGQADPRDVGASAYMLANGQGKTRARRNGEAIPPKSWNTLFLSSGEVPLIQYLKTAGIAVKGGQEIRMPDLPACPVGGNGVLESIGQYQAPAEFIRALESAVERNCGTALDLFLTRLVEDRKSEQWFKTQTARLWHLAHKLREVAPAEEIIGRVALRFALVQVALEVAHGYALLPFPVEQCDWAVQTLFTDWLNARGGAGSIEIKQACERIEHLFVSNEFGDRIYRVDEVNRDQNVRNLLAYRKTDPLDSSPEFWVPTSVFNSEFCQGIDKTLLINELLERGWLKPSTEPGRFQVQRKLGTRKIRVYVFKIFWDNVNPLGTVGTTGTEVQTPLSETIPELSIVENGMGTQRVPMGTDPSGYPSVPVTKTGVGTEYPLQNPLPGLVSGDVPMVPVVPVQNLKNSNLEKIDDGIDWVDIDPSEIGGAA